jgi:hypothetical protein
MTPSKFRLVALFLVIFVSFAKAQSNQEQPVSILYDPLFWREQLKLDPSQCRRILEINRMYYDKLYAAARTERNNQMALNEVISKSLQDRSSQIWQTFHARQKKKWLKMWEGKSASESLHGTAALFNPLPASWVN